MLLSHPSYAMSGMMYSTVNMTADSYIVHLSRKKYTQNMLIKWPRERERERDDV